MQRGPLPRSWTFAAIAVAIVIINFAGVWNGGLGAGVAALAIAVLVGLAAKALYFRTHR